MTMVSPINLAVQGSLFTTAFMASSFAALPNGRPCAVLPPDTLECLLFLHFCGDSLPHRKTLSIGPCPLYRRTGGFPKETRRIAAERAAPCPSDQVAGFRRRAALPETSSGVRSRRRARSAWC